MAQPHLTPRLAEAEEALTILFCLIDDAYALLNPRGARRYAPVPAPVPDDYYYDDNDFGDDDLGDD